MTAVATATESPSLMSGTDFCLEVTNVYFEKPAIEKEEFGDEMIKEEHISIAAGAFGEEIRRSAKPAVPPEYLSMTKVSLANPDRLQN